MGPTDALFVLYATFCQSEILADVINWIFEKIKIQSGFFFHKYLNKDIQIINISI